MSAITDGSSSQSNGKGVKTLAIRLDTDVHAQLTMIASLRDSTITDEIKTALAAHIELAKTASDLAARADAARVEIEQEAAARKAALATLFDSTSDKSAPRRGRASS